MDGAPPVSLNYANNLQVVEGGYDKKEPLLRVSQSARWVGRVCRLQSPMAGCADSETAPASHCLLVVGDSLGHAQGAEPSSSRAAAAEGGAGRARVSATELQVAAGVGFRLSSEGECCPPTPPIPWPAQSPVSTAHRSPGGHEGQRRSGAWGMANARWGAARWAVRPLPGNNQGSAEGGRDPSPS